MSEEKIYQPGWGEKKKHHHYHSSDNRYTNSWGGWMKMRDRQAYYGLMFAIIAVLGFGAYKLVMMFVNEWRAMPHDDPATEMKVDELRIHKVDEQDALLYGDSLAQVYQFDNVMQFITAKLVLTFRTVVTSYLTGNNYTFGISTNSGKIFIIQ